MACYNVTKFKKKCGPISPGTDNESMKVYTYRAALAEAMDFGG